MGSVHRLAIIIYIIGNAMKSKDYSSQLDFLNINAIVKKSRHKFILGLTVYILFLLYMFFIIDSYNIVEKTLYIFFIYIIFFYFLLIFLINSAYKKYSMLFRNNIFSRVHIIFLFFLDSSIVFSIVYNLYVYDYALRIYLIIIFSIITFCCALYAINIFKKNMSCSFSKFYFKVSKNIYCDYKSIVWISMTFNKKYSILLTSLLVFTSFQGVLAPYIVTIGLLEFLCHLMFVYYLSEYIYFCFIFQPHIEKYFRQPVLSDYWGFFEKDKKLKKKILGSTSTKTPLQYDEIFSKNNNIK